MLHNHFTPPTEFSMVLDEEENARYELCNLLQAQTILDVLDDVDYDTKEIERILKQYIEENHDLDSDTKKEVLGRLYVMLSENGYLRTISFKNN